MSTGDIIGGVAGGLAAAFTTHPLDIIRIRRQLRLENNRGVYYRGLVAAAGREAVYCGVKLGLYIPFRDQLETVVPVGGKLLTASICGALATAASHPLDVIKVVKAVNVSSSYPTILKNLTSRRQLWRGCVVAVERSMLFSGSQLAAYDSTKQWLLDEVDGIDHRVAVILSSWIAGTVSTLVSAPVENVKTRIQAARFTSTMDCVRSIAKHEGMLSFWRGGLWIWLRLGPYTVVQLVVWEYARGALNGTVPAADVPQEVSEE